MSAQNIISNNFADTVLTQGPASWLDICFGILVSPLKTLGVISNPELYAPRLSALIGSMLAVIITALSNSCVGMHSLGSSELAGNTIASILANLFFWLVLAIFLRLLAALINVQASIRSCLIVTGWAFLPLIFKASAACFSNVTPAGDLLSLGISIWFLILLVFAFDSLLKLGRLKTFAFMLFLPPCLFFLISLPRFLPVP